MCNIYCVSETTPFIWSASKTVWISNNGETKRILSPFTKELTYSAEKNDSLHFMIEVPYGQQKIAPRVHWLVSSAQTVTTVSHSMYLSPYLVLPLTVCPLCELSCSQCSRLIKKLPFNFLSFFFFLFFFWLDISRTLTQRRRVGGVLWPLNKLN